MLRYGFIAAGNIIRAMHRGAELNAEYKTSEIGIFLISMKRYAKTTRPEAMQHLTI